MDVRFCDETDFGVGWVAAEPAYMERASHALAVGGRVWLVDPVDGEGVAERVLALGEPAGILQLLDRHPRDGEALAARFGVPLHRVPTGRVEGAPFEFVPLLRRPWWRESALWWDERRVFVCGDVLGTAAYFLAPGERLAVHPLLRALPPRPLRDMSRGLAPRHVLCGHGEGVHGADAAAAFAAAVSTARRRIPRYLRGRMRRR